MPLLSPDLIYYCGQSIPWDPRSKDLGGSEQAVVELSRHWSKSGLRVEVYGSISEVMVFDGVTYRPIQEAAPMLWADVVVLWRLYGLIGFWKEQHSFQCRLMAVDFHDRELFGHEELLYQSRNQLHALMFKSQFHADFLLNKLPPEKQAELRNLVRVIPNGIRKQDFTLADPPPREPHRFCYASCYLRGLVPLIRHFWPTVRQLWPDAELHVYYGMDHVRDPATRQTISEALKSAGVQEHGRQPVTVICDEKHRSSFHLYYTNSVVETDCISIKESAYAGCIPIISGVNVFAERSGIVMPGNAVSEQDFRQAAQAFVAWVQKTSEAELQSIRKSLHDVKSHLDWQHTAQQWQTALVLVQTATTWSAMTKIYTEELIATPTPKNKTSSPASAQTDWQISSIQYISLPSSTARARWMETELAKTCPKHLIHRLEAIVGKTHHYSEEERALFRNSDFKDNPHFMNIAGNCLSHMRAWEQASREPRNNATVIFQDDAILISDFMSHLRNALANTPTDTLALFISDHEYAAHNKFIPVDLEGQDLEARSMAMKSKVNALICKHQDTWADHCSLAYVVTPHGAQQLLEYTRKRGFLRATDRFLRDVVVRQDKNYCSIRCLATSSSKHFKSDVWAQ